MDDVYLPLFDRRRLITCVQWTTSTYLCSMDDVYLPLFNGRRLLTFVQTEIHKQTRSNLIFTISISREWDTIDLGKWSKKLTFLSDTWTKGHAVLWFHVFIFQVNEIAGACHSCTSKHYLGRAVDVHNPSDQTSYMVTLCEDMGGYGLDEGNHVHCHFFE